MIYEWHEQNISDQRALRRVAADLRALVMRDGAAATDPDAIGVLRDIEAVERVASWIGNRVTT